MHGDTVLEHFALEGHALLGVGGESKVYALNKAQVLRVYRDGVDPAYVERLRRFYTNVSDETLPFELPVMEEIASIGGALYAIEKRIHGRSLSQFLLASSGDARRDALRSFMRAADYIQTIPIDEETFGELLTSQPVRRPDWPAYLRARVEQTLRQSYAELSADVPGLAEVISSWEVDIGKLDYVATPRLAHGDYFPANVIVDKVGEIAAVIDFSPMTIGGDARLDSVCALIFLELDEGYREGDVETILGLIDERRSVELVGLRNVYRIYYSLYFSACKQTDPHLYRWCVANLSRASEGSVAVYRPS